MLNLLPENMEQPSENDVAVDTVEMIIPPLGYPIVAPVPKNRETLTSEDVHKKPEDDLETIPKSGYGLNDFSVHSVKMDVHKLARKSPVSKHMKGNVPKFKLGRVS